MALEDVETFWRTEPGPKVRLRHGWPGEFIEADQTYELSDLWDVLLESSPYYASIYRNYEPDLMNPDTLLQRRDGTAFQHCGAFTRSSK